MDRIPAPTDPPPGRSCGGCSLCCKIMGVPETDEPRGACGAHGAGIACEARDAASMPIVLPHAAPFCAAG